MATTKHTPKAMSGEELMAMIKGLTQVGSVEMKMTVPANQRAALLNMPEGPTVTCFEPLRECADAVDRANGPAEGDRAVGAHQRSMTALSVDKARTG